MPARKPGSTYSATATKELFHGAPAVELLHAGRAAKSMQPAPAVPSTANALAATKIEIGEDFVIMLDGSHEFPTSYLPEGAVAGERLWIDPATNKLLLTSLVGSVHPAVRITVTASGGTFTTTIDGEVSGAIKSNTTAAELLAVLNAMSNINPGDVTVTGGPGNATPLVITFVAGRYSNGPAPAITTQVGALEGTKTAVVENATVGVAGTEGVKYGLIDEIDTDTKIVTVNLSQRSSF